MIFDSGVTSQSVDVQIVDDTGLPVTGLVAATFPTLTYSLAGANADVAFPALSDLALITTAYASGGVKERGNGVYRLDVPNGVFTTAGQVRIRGEATGKHVLCPIIDVAPAVNTTRVSGTAQTARDLGNALPAAAAGANGGLPTLNSNLVIGANVLYWNAHAVPVELVNGVPIVSLKYVLATALTETVAGNLAGAFKTMFDVGSPVFTTASVNQTGDAYNLVNTRLTAARAGYLDNLNVGGAVASHADILAINQSASKHLLLTTVGQYAPSETYTIEARTFAAADGSAVNADSTPTLTATGTVSGSLSGNLSAATNPATGVYRWTYTPGSSPTLEQIRFDLSATISAATFTLSTYAQTVDQPSVVWTATDQSHLTAIFNKLPTNNIADETLLLAAIGAPLQAGNVTVGGYATGEDPATLLLATPANKLATDSAGRVTPVPGSSSATVAGYATGQDPATLLLDVLASAHNTANTIGAKINAAGGAADPLGNAVPGSYPAGSAGYLLGKLGPATVTVVSPVAQSGAVTIVRGDDYKTADARELTFTNAAGSWPNLTSATINFAIRNPLTAAILLQTAGAVVTPTGSQVVSVDLTAAQTNPLPVSTPAQPLLYQLVATLSDGHVTTLQEGSLIVLQNATT